MAVLPNFNLEKEYEIVFNNTQDALFIVEVDEKKDFRFLKLNPTHENLTGLKTIPGLLFLLKVVLPETTISHEKCSNPFLKHMC